MELERENIQLDEVVGSRHSAHKFTINISSHAQAQYFNAILNDFDVCFLTNGCLITTEKKCFLVV